MTLVQYTVAPKLCFVIAPIGEENSGIRRHSDRLLEKILRPALADYIVKCADHDLEPGMIGEQIIRDLVFASLVVADLSFLNPNVFYELGIRHAALKPTIHMAKKGTNLPFDNFGYRTIFFDLGDPRDEELTRNHLAKMAEAAKRSEYRVRNPVTQASIPMLLREHELTKEEQAHRLIDLFRELKRAGVGINTIMEAIRRKADLHDIKVETERRLDDDFLVVHLDNGWGSFR